ncbi:hypothetical protein [Georgenia thermotolerans]|uniref:hypothetical protein n=1 Tax=Georgenia thermotolerans TaxID=527326 RepID=UPI0012647426|nr:hypothetical protein [Georgenia thermotolerans]
MSLLTATKTGPRHKPKGPKCGVGKVMESLAIHADADNEASIKLANLYLILENPEWTGEEIAAEMREDGYDIQGPAVARHRRGACKCEEL